MKKDSFVFYRSFADAMIELPEAEQLAMFLAITYYGLDKDKPTFTSSASRMMWALIQPQLDANWRRYENGCKGGEFGKLGGAPIGNKNAKKNKTTPKQPLNNPKTTPNDNDNVNDNDNDNDNTKKTTKIVKERHSLSFDERKAAFQKSIEPYKGKYSSEMLNEFFPYWTEPTPNGKKMRFELEKTWEVGRRLATWNKRSEESRKH